MHPTNLQLTDGNRLLIEWSDGVSLAYQVSTLRDQCPCATCREKRRTQDSSPPALLPVISPEEARPLTIVAMNPVGNYAYSIHFSDGHNTGIFSLEMLREVGEPVDTSP